MTLNSSLTPPCGDGYFGGVLVIGNQLSKGKSETLIYMNMIQWTSKIHALIQWLYVIKQYFQKEKRRKNCAIINLFALEEKWQRVIEA